MRIGELFAGSGGLGMAVKGVFPDAEVAWVSEFDKGPSKVLAHRFPDVPNLGDITKIDWTQVPPVDVLAGGSPCQDLSHGGKRAGMTDGTRSNLWIAMREAVATLQPPLVLWENVRGAYSAEADSAVEPCAGCVGERPGVTLRALGRVLGDLSELGYDAAWCGLRAADVGAAHGRFRVFVLAWRRDGAAVPDADALRLQRGRGARVGRTGPADDGGGVVKVLPTPTTRDHKDHTIRREPHRPDDTDTLARALTDVPCALLPAPRVGGTGVNESEMRRNSPNLETTITLLLPTPTTADANASGGSNASNVTLTDAAVRTDCGRTENPRHGNTPEGRSREELRGVRDAPVSQEVQERATGGQERLPEASPLLAELCEYSSDHPSGLASLEGPTSEGADGLRGVWDAGQASSSPSGPRRHEQCAGEPGDAMPIVPPAPPLAGGSQREDGLDFGPYSAAIKRWEAVLGRPSPAPTVLSAKGRLQLSAKFAEFLMGVPDGWITDVPGVTRNEALKMCGNGVVPQQGAAALRWLLDVMAREVAA